MFLRNGLEPWHLLIVAVVLILLFGSKKLPDTARALGKSLRILKSETKAMREDDKGPAPAAATPQVTPAAAPVQTAAQTAAQTPTDTPPHPAQ
ncbi:Sec-independent protein translocase subunit TatA [Streptomyces sp. NBC_01431]|uniref:Sec-independent protein translocase subunit TatA n=1 Tax=Streptomyces sp. NBC_01431 TaxID=2903863 RepID=UPI002E36D11E|nr:Sec-independent protein translocase subunit TatA [Streptomyces sp. NBC_01431]